MNAQCVADEEAVDLRADELSPCSEAHDMQVSAPFTGGVPVPLAE
jgi:hypothetical protein